MIHVRTVRRLPRPTRFGLVLLLAGALLLGAVTGAMVAHAATEDVVGALHAASQNNGVPVEPLIAIARCESELNPRAVGDRGRSLGLFQLNTLPGTGLYWHFRAVGYDDAFSPEQASDYVAKVASGRWPGVSLRRWSCYWTAVR